MKASTVLQYVTHFEGWTRAHEMKGAAHPDSWDEIEEQFQLAKKRLRRAVREMEKNQ